MDCAGDWLFLPLADLRHLLRCLAQGFGSWPWDPNLAWLMNIILCPSVLLMRIAMYCLYLCNFYVIVYCCSVWSCFCGFLALVTFWLLDILAFRLGFYGSVAYVLAARTIVQTTSEALERITKKHNVKKSSIQHPATKARAGLTSKCRKYNLDIAAPKATLPLWTYTFIYLDESACNVLQVLCKQQWKH